MPSALADLTPRRTGRPTLIRLGYNDTTGTWSRESPIQVILSAVAACSFIDPAIAASGLGRTTVYQWMRRGREAIDKLGPAILDDHPWDYARTRIRPRKERPYADFAYLMMRAQATSEVAIVASWATAAKTDWRAGRDLLARRFPERWAASQNHNVTIAPVNTTPAVEAMGRALAPGGS